MGREVDLFPLVRHRLECLGPLLLLNHFFFFWLEDGGSVLLYKPPARKEETDSWEEEEGPADLAQLSLELSKVLPILSAQAGLYYLIIQTS